ncbi:MAG: DUF4115 domain-containing protein [Anaerolineae bacterium]|nr:DUF4115 domain-containing protein [Anaerolineae bacterium]
MESLGIWLSNARQKKGVSLQQAAQATCVRLRYIAMLEAGNTAALPDGPVQVRGFLGIYARYLGLRADEAFARYEAEVSGRPYVVPGGVSPQAHPPQQAPSPPTLSTQAPSPLSFTQGAGESGTDSASVMASLRRHRDIARHVALVGVLVFVFAGLATAGYFFIRGASGRATVQAIASTPLATAMLSVPAEESVVAVVVVPTTASESGATPDDGIVTVAIEATEHVWVRVLQDGQKVFDGFMSLGQMESWSGDESVAVETGNGAGLLVTFNERLQGPMCGRGEVCGRIWTPEGETAAE